MSFVGERAFFACVRLAFSWRLWTTKRVGKKAWNLVLQIANCQSLGAWRIAGREGYRRGVLVLQVCRLGCLCKERDGGIGVFPRCCWLAGWDVFCGGEECAIWGRRASRLAGCGSQAQGVVGGKWRNVSQRAANKARAGWVGWLCRLLANKAIDFVEDGFCLFCGGNYCAGCEGVAGCLFWENGFAVFSFALGSSRRNFLGFVGLFDFLFNAPLRYEGTLSSGFWCETAFFSKILIRDGAVF